jgi:hypothetical protein
MRGWWCDEGSGVSVASAGVTNFYRLSSSQLVEEDYQAGLLMLLQQTGAEGPGIDRRDGRMLAEPQLEPPGEAPFASR